MKFMRNPLVALYLRAVIRVYEVFRILELRKWEFGEFANYIDISERDYSSHCDRT